jgi:hypothetical protein
MHATAQIAELWHEHLSAVFPEEAYRRHGHDIDLVELDATVAGCVSSFLENDGLLDDTSTAALKSCLAVLNGLLSELAPQTRSYFAHLARMAELVERNLPTPGAG